MPASSKAAPPQQSRLEEMWGGKKKRKATEVDVKDELDGTLKQSGEAHTLGRWSARPRFGSNDAPPEVQAHN